MVNRQIRSIDDYIAGFPKNVQDILTRFRIVIKESAPKAQETLNYGIPTFKLNGNLVHFGAFKNHIGFYPTPSAIDAFEKDLSPYEISKGTVKFALDRPIPFELIKKIVQFRVNEVLKKDMI